MQRIGVVLLPAMLVSATVAPAATTELLPRASCSCPTTDSAFFPLGSSSSTNEAVLQCFYPDVSRCQYNVTDGSLLKDTDFGLCRTTAAGQSCPSTDLGAFPLGPGSGVHNSILFCTYPTPSQLSDQRFYCEYNQTTGVLSGDVDDGLCPITADGECSGSGFGPGTPTSSIITPVMSTNRVVSSLEMAITSPMLSTLASSTIQSTATVSSAISTANSGSANTNSKRITAIAAGSAVCGAFFLLVAIVGFIIFRRGTTGSMSISSITPFPFIKRSSPSSNQSRPRVSPNSSVQRNPYAHSPRNPFSSVLPNP